MYYLQIIKREFGVPPQDTVTQQSDLDLVVLVIGIAEERFHILIPIPITVASPPSSPPSFPPSRDEPLPPQPLQIGMFWLADFDDIYDGLPETDDLEVRVNYKVPGYFTNMNAANDRNQYRGLDLG